MLEKLLEWDQQALIYLNNLGSEQFDSFWLTVTKFPTWIPLFLLIIFLLVKTHSPKESIGIMFSFIFMLLFVTAAIFLTKENVGRLRPINDASVNTVLRALTKPSDYSFFSGHAASSFSIAMLSIFYLRKKSKWIYMILVWPLLFTFSRMYLGVHYPLDILVGSMVGILCAYFFYRMHQRLKVPYTR
ncbi:MAG: phosphatase PAP2 family protein [Maribacter sp.]|uniref:phosphatase PAP2 family protein n=1 Tax=Maribacter sp. TaxID=1897614 RepID=UPI0032980E3B